METLAEALAALKSPEPHLRREAARYCATHPDPTASESLLNALGDADPHTHEAIIVAIVQQTDAERIPRLVAMLREDNPVRQNAALNTLIEIGAHNALILASALKHSSSDVRLQVAIILGDLRQPQTTRALIERLDDPDEAPNVRHAIAQALGKIGDRTATPGLMLAAERGDFWVRYAAVEALGRLGDKRAVGTLLRLERADPWLRPATVRALGDIGNTEAIPSLVRALSDKNEAKNDAVRAAAIEALLKIVVEPVTTVANKEETQRESRLLIPVAPVLRELNAHVAPTSAQAAHLLGWLAPPEALPDLIQTLGNDDETLRQAAAEALLRYGRLAIPPLLKAVRHASMLIRENAVELLGMLPTSATEAVPQLLPLLQDPFPPVRHATLRALGALRSESAYHGLLQALDDPTSRDVAISILAKVQDQAFVEQLQRALYQAPPNIRQAAAYTLSQLGDEAAVSILLNAIRSGDDKVRGPASEALGQVQTARAIPVLIEALGDRNGLVRQRAVEALGNLPDGRVVTALLPLVNDPEWRVRKALAKSLAHLGDARMYPVLQQLARDPNHWIRRMVMDLVGGLEDPRALEFLHNGLQDADPGVRRAALISLGRKGLPASREAVVACFNDPDTAVRLEAVRAWSLMGSSTHVSDLFWLVEAPQEEVRREVADALGELGTEEALRGLERLLQDEAQAVRMSAAQALGTIGTQTAIEILAAAIVHPKAHVQAHAQLVRLGPVSLRVLLALARASDAALRREAAKALGALKHKDSVPTLQILAQDPDPKVQAAAKEALDGMAAAK